MSTLFLHDHVITLENGIAGEPFVVESANPTTFYEAISQGGGVTQSIHAQTFVPTGTSEPPLVVVVPGSMGIAPSHVYKAELLTNAGFAACLLDPFGAREVSSTVSNQAQFSFAASAWDVLATLETLQNQQRFSRYGLQGHSRGGSAIQLAVSMANYTRHEVSIDGLYMAYPWCGFQFLNPGIGSTTVRSIIGDQDEWCLPQQVQGYTQSLCMAGVDASCRIVAGAHHSFDRDTPVELVADASVSPGAPTVFVMDDGTCVHPVLGPCPSDTSDRELMLYGIKAGYGVRGARIGTAENFADVFHEDMMNFWQQVFEGE